MMFSTLRVLVVLFIMRSSSVAFLYRNPRKWKSFASVATPSMDGNTGNWKDVMKLPSTYAAHPMAKPDAPSIPLEQMLPMFVTLFHTNCQCQVMSAFSPAIALHKQDQKYIMMTLNNQINNMSKMPHFISFKTFIRGCQTPPDAAVAKEAYLMMSHFAKCTQVVIAFGMLVMKTFQKQQMTYGGERVIGWAIQDGRIKLDHPNIPGLQVIDVTTDKLLSDVKASVKSGKPLPAGVTSMAIARNNVHVWLTFVTESGRIYDLDLSAFQFGIMDPFPCIVPVLSAEPTAFSGMVERHCLLCTDMSTFRLTVQSLTDAHVAGVNSVVAAGGSATSAMMQQPYLAIIDIISRHGQSELPKFANPAYFWNLLFKVE